MERKFLEELGLDKETIEKIMDAYGKGIEKQKKMTDAAEAERDSLRGQLSEVSEQIKAFDGVDVDALKGEVDKVRKELEARESDFAAQIAQRDFETMLNDLIFESKGKNPKLIMAALDKEAIKSSEDQKESARAAIRALSQSDAYLFSDPVAQTPAKVSTGGNHDETGKRMTSTNETMNALIKGKEKGE